MKKIRNLLFTLAVLTLCLLLLPTEATAASVSDLTFKLSEDGNSYIVADCATSASGALTIPSTYDGKPVTAIGGSAFYGCESLTSVIIPDSVTSISDHAFHTCKSLTSINIPDSVTAIGETAFYKCVSMQTVTISNCLTDIGRHVFDHCESLTSVTIPDSVTSIGDYAFYHCVSMQTVTISNRLADIGCFAFSHCESLTSVTIPDSVTSIGDYAFSYCIALTSVTMGDGVSSIGDSAFNHCMNLEDVWYFGSNTDRTNIAFSSGNNPIKFATWHYLDCLDGTEHTYSNGCDATCNKCEKVRTNIQHTYDDNSDTVCNICQCKRFYLSYNAMGGNPTPNSKWVESEADTISFSISTTVPSKDGYVFLGWCSIYGDVFHRPGSSVTVRGPITHLTLYAIWAENCSGCDGTGEAETICTVCNGRGSNTVTRDCSFCTNGSVRTCKSCGGTSFRYIAGYGFYQCNTCNGLAYRTSTCSWCSGSGGSQSTVDCSYCVGGTITGGTCTVCLGEGKHIAITWIVDGKLTTIQVKPGDTSIPRYTGSTDKPADEKYTYTFNGWNKAITSPTEHTIYIATYTARHRDYSIVFKNWDGIFLSSKTYHYGDKIIAPEDPVKTPDNLYCYTFAGWDKPVVDCAGSATYTATFTPQKHAYTGENCTFCQQAFLLELVDYNRSATVIKTSGANIWSKPYSSGTSQTVRTAAFDSKVTVVGYATNASGSLWYKLSDGNWVYSTNIRVTDYNPADVENINKTFVVTSWGANIWSKPYSSGDSQVIRSEAKTAALKAVAQVRNSTGGLWYMLEDGNWIYSKNVNERIFDPADVIAYKRSATVIIPGVVNIWGQPSTSAPSTLTRTAAYQTKLNVVAKYTTPAGGLWYQLTDGNWVYSSNIRITDYNTADVQTFNKTVVVTSWGANVWSKPYSSGNSKVVKTVAKSANLKVKAQVRNSTYGLWYQLADGSGWIYSKNVAVK